MKMIYTLISWLMPTLLHEGGELRGDPLSHPAVRMMDPDELADLPFASMRSRRKT